MKSTMKTAALSALVKSPLNVREVRDEDPIVAQVAASIAAKGLIAPIAVHALKKPKGALGVLAGQRRWRAIAKLQADGIAFDFANIPIILFEGADAELKEVSQAENVIREQMRPSEIYAGYRDIKTLDPSLTEADFAQRFGIDPARMARIMRLALLHPTVFDAYDKGKLKDEQAYAYASTTDQELQLQTYELLAKRPEYQRHPADIRRAMKVGDGEVRGLLAFVGLDTYVAAGGIFEIDLFAQEANSGRVMDEELLRRLANDKLETVKAELAAQHAATGELTFVEKHPGADKYGYVPYELQVRTQPGAATEEQRDRLKAIEERDNAIEDELASHDDWYDDEGEPLAEHVPRIEALHAEQKALSQEEEAIRDGIADIIPEGPKLGIIKLRPAGDVSLELYWAEKPKTSRGSSGAGAVAKSELTDKGRATLERMRANMFGAFLFDSLYSAASVREEARDALIYSLARAIAHNASPGYYERGAALGLTGNYAGAFYTGYGDAEIFEPDLSDIPGLDAEDSITGFALYRTASPGQKDRLAAYVYYRKVHGELFREGRRSIPEMIGGALSVPMIARRAWTPTTSFMGLFKKDKILGWLGDIHKQFKVDFGRYKSADLKESAAAFFAADDEAVTRFAINNTADEVRRWVPEWLRWNSEVSVEVAKPAPTDEEGAAPADADELEEAAE